MISFDGVVKVLEGIDSLLENLDYGDAAHIFDRFDVHFFEGLHVFLHKVLAFVHLGAERDDCIGDWNDGRDSQSPVKYEHQDKRCDGDDDGACQVGELMRNERMRDSGVVVDDFADASGGVFVKETERQLEQFLHGNSADVAFEAERNQVRADECCEIK